jgi:hypothetical protein
MFVALLLTLPSAALGLVPSGMWQLPTFQFPSFATPKAPGFKGGLEKTDRVTPYRYRLQNHAL